MTRSKICMLVFNEFRPDMRVYNEALMLQNSGRFDVRVLALKKKDSVPDREVMKGGVKVERIPVPERELYLNFFMPMYRTSIVPLVYRHAKEEGADAYHCHDIYTLPMGVQLKKKDNVPVIYDAHEPNYGTFLASKPLPGMPAKVREISANTYERTASAKLDGMILTTEFAVEEKKRLGYTVTMHVIPYRANPDYFDPKITSKKLEEKYTGKRVIIFIGGLSDTKGFSELLSAFKLVKEKADDAHLLIVGEVVPWLDPGKRIEELGLTGSVEITSYLPYWEVAKYINVAELGIMLSSPEQENYRLTLPNKVIDYMACGKPFIGTPLTQVQKIIQEEECGVLVKSLEPTHVAEAITGLLSNEAGRKEMGARGLEAVRTRYSWNAVENDLARIFDELVSV